MTQGGQPGSALTRRRSAGARRRGAGDLSVETHGIAPIREDQRYGTPRRLFTVWFAPQVNMTGVFTGALAIVLGLGFWLGLLAMVIGTVLGSLVVAYLSTWGPRTGAAQLPNSRMAFGAGVVLPGALQWLSSIAWDGLVGLFGGEALAVLLGIPFWGAVLIVLGVQGAVGFFGYEMIHRIQAVLTVVLFVTFVVFAVKLAAGHQVVTPATVHGADLAGAFVLEVTIALSLSISWASYAADFSRYLPPDSSRIAVFGYTFAGIVLAYIFVQGIGIAGRGSGVRPDRRGCACGDGRRHPWRRWPCSIIALASIGSGVMNDYSGSLALQTIGVRVRRPGVGGRRHGDRVRADPVAARRRHGVAVPERAVVRGLLDPGVRRGGGHRLGDAQSGAGRVSIPPRSAPTVSMPSPRWSPSCSLTARPCPFMNTSLFTGPVAEAWHGADIAYFVNFLVAALALRRLPATACPSRELGQVEPGGLIATPFIQPDGVGVSCQRAEDHVIDTSFVQVALESLEQLLNPDHFRGIREAH